MRLVKMLLLAVLLAGVASTDINAGQHTAAAEQIDAIIRLDLKKHELQPNPPVSDVQFVRRVYLDVIGRIPSDQELASFHADTREDRRARLIDALLESPGHESHMFNWLGADDGSTEGGITESLAMMNGEVTKSIMASSLAINSTRNISTRAEQIVFLYRTCLSRLPREQDTNQCIAALDQGLDLGDIAWALLNSREFMFIQ